MTEVARANDVISPAGRGIGLLTVQAFTLGLTIAWIVVPSSALFLDAFGSGLLPVTYIGAAALGAATTSLLARALRRRSLATIAMRVAATMAATLTASWVLLVRFEATWVSFGLVAFVPILIPVGFVFLIGQAGMLLDVRVIKAFYPRVIAGCALGFVVGGLAAPPLLSALGGAEHLLAAGACAAGAFLMLVAFTKRTFPAELSTIAHDDDGGERPTLRSLLANRYVVLIMSFQALSAIESQWLDYLVLDRAAQRYEDSVDLARFIGRFAAIAYGADILFLVAGAGYVMRRFGLRSGLPANPVVVLSLVVAIIGAAVVRGTGSTVVFMLIVATRVSDMVLSDGTTRTSVGAAYQVVPLRERLAAQATVEGLSVPLAIGFSGLVLIVVRSTVGTDGLMLPILTTLVLVAWVAVALAVYRGYRVNLLANLRHRTLDPSELTIDGVSTMAVLDRLLDSPDDRDVRLGLDTLTRAQHPDLASRLERLATGERVALRSDALERLVVADPARAAAAARNGLDHTDARVRAASLRTLALVGGSSDVPAVVARARDVDDGVRLAATVALSHVGDDVTRRGIAESILTLARSSVAERRIESGRMLGQCAAGPWIDRHLLHTLLADPDHEVVVAALSAVRWADDAELMVDVLGRLSNRRTAGAAVNTLVGCGSDVLALVDEGLDGRIRLGRQAQELLARVCRLIGGPHAVTVLRRHVGHRDRDVGLAVMEALAVLGALGSSDAPDAPDSSGSSGADEAFGAPCIGVALGGPVGVPSDGNASDELVETVIRADLEHATHVLRALRAFDAWPSAGPLRAALHDELVLLRRRVLAGLSLRYGSEGLSRVAFQLAQHSTKAHALAVEWLDVTMTGTERVAIALLDPGRPADEQLRALTRLFPVEPSSAPAMARDLVEDRDARWRRPWITACALLALSGVPDSEHDPPRVSGIDGSADHELTDELAIVVETLSGIRQRRTSSTPPVSVTE